MVGGSNQGTCRVSCDWQRPSRLPRAFSLIELLLATWIIAILAGLSFPVRAVARESANGAARAPNVRQIVVQMRLDAQQNLARLPYGAGSGRLAQDTGAAGGGRHVLPRPADCAPLSVDGDVGVSTGFV